MKLSSFTARKTATTPFPAPSSRAVELAGSGLSAGAGPKEIESVGPNGGQSGADECSEIQHTTRPVTPATSTEAVPSVESLSSAPSHGVQGDPASAQGVQVPAHETAGAEPLSRLGRPPEVVPTENEARALLAAYLKTNLTRERGSMTTAARLFAHNPACSPELREAILRENGTPRASKHQLPRPVKRAMQASLALVTYSRNPRNADVMMGHARGVLRRHWSEDRRLRAGECQTSDDGTINFVVCVPWPWGGCKCSDKYGVKIGRFQLLPVLDCASDRIISWTYVIRASGAYRAEDVCGVLGRTWRDQVKPDVAVLERGIWESQRVTSLMQAAGVQVNRSYAPRQKLIEGVFNRLWTILAPMPGQVGRYRAEMERENKLLAAAQAGSLDPREAFVDLTVAIAAMEQAVQFFNRQPIESKQYGKWVPDTRWREDLASHPRQSLNASLAYLWAPEVRTWTVRRACVGGMVEQPLGVSLPSHWWSPDLLDLEGRKVTAHFDPWEAQSPATLALAEDWPIRGWKAGRVIATAVPCLEDLPTIARDAANALAVQFGDGDPSGALHRAKQMRSTLRSIVLREYRAVAADGSRARRETEVRAPSSAVPTGEQPTGGVPSVSRSAPVRPDPTDDDIAALEAAERRAQERGIIPAAPALTT